MGGRVLETPIQNLEFLSIADFEHIRTEFKIHPNPHSDKSTIYKTLKGICIVYYDVFGRIILKSKTQKSIELNGVDFKTEGMYFYKAIDVSKIIRKGTLLAQ